MKTKIFLFSLLIWMSGIVLGQNYIYVPGDYPTIQEGIDAAMDGDTVLVDQDTYEENISLRGKSIFVTSNYLHTLDSDDIYNTIIDGSKPADTNQASVVLMPFGSDTNSVICGFTIRGGSGTQYANRIGGGILCFDGGKIIHNRIIDNTVFADEHALGSGIFVQGISSSYFIIKNNTIENNHLENANSDYISWGTIGIHTGDIIVKNNIIRYNTAKGRPYGVGMYLNNVKGLISHNIISYNTGSHILAGKSRGGGMYVVNIQPGLEIINNEITHNQLIWDSGGGPFRYGGGIAVLNTGGFEYNAILIDKNIIKDNFANLGGGIAITEIFNIRLSNNVIRDNEAEMDGGGIFLQAYTKGNKNPGSDNNSHNVYPIPEKKSLEKPLLVNNTIINNHAGYDGGGIASLMNAEDFIAFNNIIYENTATTGSEAFLQGNCNGYFYNNNIDTNDIGGAGTWIGINNIYVAPTFTDTLCHLDSLSPCLNKGVDSIFVEGIWYHAPFYDLEGNPRPDTFCFLFDLGAYERQDCFSISIESIDQTAAVHYINVYPNPFSTTTNIEYELKIPRNVQIRIFNHLGQIVESIDKGNIRQGNHQYMWNSSGLPNGVYFVQVSAGQEVATKKVIKIR